MIAWYISQLERHTLDGGVITAHWGCVGSDQGVSINHEGLCIFTPDSTSPDFIPFDKLTEVEVLQWVFNQVGKETIEADVQARLDAKLNPTVVAGVPW